MIKAGSNGRKVFTIIIRVYANDYITFNFTVRTQSALLNTLFISTFLLFVFLMSACQTSAPVQERLSPIHSEYEFDEDLAIDRMSQSIQYATVTVEDTTLVDYPVFDEFIDFIIESYPLINEHLSLEIIGGHSMLYTWEGSNPDLKAGMFIGHYDVVPVERATLDAWTYPPFSGEVAEGFIWGRGALDDKGGVMSVMEAVEYLLEQDFQPERTIYIALNHDEEIGGLLGARRIAQHLHRQDVQLEYLMDEGSPIAENIIDGIELPLAMIGVAKKGAVNLRLVYTEDGGHSSMPPAVGVIGTLSRAVQAIEDNPMSTSYRGLITETFEPLIPYMSYRQRLAFNNPWLFRRVIERQLGRNPATNAALRTTAGVTMFNVGVKENVLPVEGYAIINFRIHPNDSVQSVIDHIESVIDNPDIDIQVMPRAREPSRVSSTDAEPYKKLERTIGDLFPDALIVPSLFIAGSDSRHFHDLTENIYRFRPIRATHNDRSRVHGIDERIRLYNYLEMVQFQIDFIRNTAGAD